MQSLSRSAEIHERMMVESPKESEVSKAVGNEQYNSNGNNNSPGDTSPGVDGAYPSPISLESRSDPSFSSVKKGDGDGGGESRSCEEPVILNTVYDLWTSL